MSSIHQGRPLSPHLQIYKIQITSLLSVLHRATGIVLFGGSFVWALYFLALALGPQLYDAIHRLLCHPLGLLALGGFCFSLCYHLCNGLRHLFWDLGYGYEMPIVRLTGWGVIISSLLCTSFIMGCILSRVFTDV